MCLSVHRTRSHVIITDDALDLTIQGPLGSTTPLLHNQPPSLVLSHPVQPSAQIQVHPFLIGFIFSGTKLTGHISNFIRDIAPFMESIDAEDVFYAGDFFGQSMFSKGESSALQKLKMTSCNHSEDFWQELFYLLFICKKLTHLIISRNSLGKAGHRLAQSISKWRVGLPPVRPPFQVLQLDQCLMPEDAWDSIFKSLHDCKYITHLDLSYNRLGDSGSVLAQVISHWTDKSPLQKLNLSYCSMSAKACDRLFRSLIHCKCLSYLDLSGNMAGNAGHQLAETIKSWGDYPLLERFIVEHCFIPIAVWPGLLTSLSACSKLKFLDLSHNNLTGCLSSFLSGRYQFLANLEEFLLDSCALNEDDLWHLIQCVKLQKLPSLQNLYLHDNSLFRIEDILGKLIQSCIDYYSEKKIKLWVQWNSLSQDFMNTWVAQCENTNVKLDLQPASSSEKSASIKVNETCIVS